MPLWYVYAYRQGAWFLVEAYVHAWNADALAQRLIVNGEIVRVKGVRATG